MGINKGLAACGRFLGVSSLCLSLTLNGFAQEVEITHTVAAHKDDSNFRIGSAKLGFLPAGTKGELIGAPEKLPSGNYGVYMAITEIDHETDSLKVGSKVWVYYDQDPTRNSVTLYDAQNQKVVNPALAVAAKTTQTMKPIATATSVEQNLPGLSPKGSVSSLVQGGGTGESPQDQVCSLPSAPIALTKMGLPAAFAALVQRSENHSLEKPDDVHATKYRDHGKNDVIYEQGGKKYEYKNGTLSWRDHNPGNIDAAPNEIGRNGHACFASDLDGLTALRDLLTSKYSNKTINNMFNKYAKNHAGYSAFVEKRTKLNPNKPLKDFTPDEISLIMGAIVMKEGYEPGQVVALN